MTTPSSTERLVRPAALIAVAALVAVLALALGAYRAQEAGAAAKILEFSATTTHQQAGGHPDLLIHYEADLIAEGGAHPEKPSDAVKDLLIELPPGVIGDPHVIPTCKVEDFGQNLCAPSSQIGLIMNRVANTHVVAPLYNMDPRPGQAGLLAFKLPVLGFTPIFIEISARTGSDYGLNAEVQSISRFGAGYEGFDQILWGVPADPVHDPVRFPTNLQPFGQVDCPPSPYPEVGPHWQLWVENKIAQCEVNGGSPPPLPGPTASDVPPAPFLSNPTTCVGPQEARITTTDYAEIKTSMTAPFPATTGCDQLDFNPSLAAKPTTTWTDTASGLDIDLQVPQPQSPTSPSPSQLEGVTITLPEGFSINPNAANGKVSCSDAAANFGTELGAECPEHAKIGTSTIESSALPGPLPGAIYIADPKPGDPYRVILTGDGFGTHIKIPGSVRPDPQTGRLTLTMENLPQSPLQRFQLHVFGSERGLLATPTQCGTYAVESEFDPWSGDLGNQKSTQFFVLDGGPSGAPCPAPARGFAPGLQAGTSDNTAALHTTFGLDVTRPDGNQFLSRLDVNLPRGFSARLAGVPYCPEAAISALSDPNRDGATELATPACPAASQVGSTVIGAGAGTRPLHVGGRAYLAGPYRGAPLSLVIVTPALSGPYDLGTVAVRVALHIDPTTAQIKAVSDPLPAILDGIPLRLRRIQVVVDRPSFALNPTNCDPFSVDAGLFGDQGALALASSHFQVTDCADLGFGPRFRTTLKGPPRRAGNPALTAVLKPRGGDANLRHAVVALPKVALLDNEHIGTVCNRVQLAARQCPADSVYGSAQAETPLLAQPLAGPVYLSTTTTGSTLPDLVVDLRGQVDIQLRARIDSPKRGGLRTRFIGVPDVPVSNFVLRMKGGKRGLLTNSENLCRLPDREKRSSATFRGQNGAVMKLRPILRANCGKARKSKRRARLHRIREAG